jgi:hypothetical protein
VVRRFGICHCVDVAVRRFRIWHYVDLAVRRLVTETTMPAARKKHTAAEPP